MEIWLHQGGREMDIQGDQTTQFGMKFHNSTLTLHFSFGFFKF